MRTSRFRRPFRVRGRAVGCVLAAAGAVQSAHATWSIILIDTRTGEVAIGSATCLTGFDLRENTPVLLTGIGGATAQSAVDSTGQNRVFLRDQMLEAEQPGQIIANLAGFDTSHQSRQYGIVDVRGNGRAATFTGTGAGQYRGGRTGRLIGAGITGGDVVYAIQGNVLTGAPVIDAAAQALLATTGDLAAKLMASMEAARAMGGDGRCSCSVSNPTSCGSPPEAFAKSAHVAYMLIARAGDRDGYNGIYRVGSAPQSTIAADLNNDGYPELITSNGTASSISTLINQTLMSPTGVPIFTPAPTNSTVASSPRDMVAGDFNNDGVPDVAVVNLVSDSVSILLGRGDGTFQTRVNYGAGDGPLAIVSGDFDRDGDLDLAVANQLSNNVTILANNGSATFTSAQTVPSGSGPAAISARDLDQDGDLDLVVGAASSNAIIVVRNISIAGGAPNFFQENSLPAGRGISGVVAADFDRDGLPDLAACATTDNRVTVYRQSSLNVFTQAGTHTVSTNPTGLRAADVTGDGIIDLVTVTRQTTDSRLGVLAGRGDAGFDPARMFFIGLQPGRFDLVDLNDDGDLDAVMPVTTNGNSVLVIENLGLASGGAGGGVAWGGFNSGLGCASGDYFMNFDVADQQSSDPDPVLTLRTWYEQWRSSTTGHPDAVRTLVVIDRSAVPADNASTTRLHIMPRDWRQQPVSLGSGSITVTHAPGSDGVSIIGAAIANPDGSYSVTLRAGVETGSDQYLIRLQDDRGGRPVVLMPTPSLGVFVLDRDDNGQITSDDFFRFLSDYLAGNADLNGDGATDTRDFFDFLAAFFAGG